MGEHDEMEESMKGKHSPPGAGNVYAKANEVIVKVTGDDTGQTFEVVEENCKPGFQSRAHYHIKAYETFYVFEGSADFQVGRRTIPCSERFVRSYSARRAASGDFERRRADADDL
jgi:quercetin dioxygenase-like cupin family protein